MEAGNSSEIPMQLCQRVISDAELFGISEEAMCLFSSMGPYEPASGDTGRASGFRFTRIG